MAKSSGSNNKANSSKPNKDTDNKKVEATKEETIIVQEPSQVDVVDQKKPVLKDAKKEKALKKSEKKKNSFLRKILNYFKDLKIELKRVVWPNKKRVTRNAIVVLTTVVVVSIMVVLCDLGFTNLLKLLFGKF